MKASLPDIAVVAHTELTDADLARLAALFDGEYLDEHGPWTPDAPYGYAGHDVHVLARDGGDLIGHVGWARRAIGVGVEEVVIGGVGGVLVAPNARGTSVGRRLMDAVSRSMHDAGGIDFGYLGCREAVASFYASCGWTRVAAEERYVDRVTGERVTDAAGPPLFIRGVGCDEAEWPVGPIDLRGRPW